MMTDYHHHHHHHHLHPTEEETEARMTSNWDLNPDSLTLEMKCATTKLYCGPQGKQEKREGRNEEQVLFEVNRLRQCSL